MSKPNKIEAFEIMRINRSQISEADYNPRKISDSAVKKQHEFMKKLGLLSPLVWNIATGTLVSGHRRLARMDKLMRYPSKVDDYELTVAAVDLTLDDEVKANVFLNNPAAMGEWDYEILGQLKDIVPNLDYEKDLGFEREEIDLFMDTTSDVDLSNLAPDSENVVAVPPKEMSEEEREELRAAKKAARDKAKEDNQDGAGYAYADADYSLSVVFRTAKEKQQFNELIGIAPGEKWCTADQLMVLLEA